MEQACVLCYNLVLQHKPHPALKKISELKGSQLFKCCCCYAYLHKHDADWEIISGGDFSGEPNTRPPETTAPTKKITSPVNKNSNNEFNVQH